MGISVGNLHYHYANKGVVILKLQEEFILESNEIANKLSGLTIEAEAFRLRVTETFTLIHKYRFLFNERLLLYRKMPEVRDMFSEMIENRRRQFLAQVDSLKSMDLIRKDLTDKQYYFLFDQIVILYNSWSSHISLFAYDANDTTELINRYVEMISAIWIPYFTPAGLEIFSV